MGLGVHGGGLGVVNWLAKHNLTVKVTDLKTRSALRQSLTPLAKYPQIKYRLGSHAAADFAWADVVIASPDVRSDNQYLQIARQAGAEIYNDVSFFMKLCPARVIGVTGTKGKSTTASLLYAFLRAGKRKVYLGGNIRISPFTFLDKLKVNDWVVLEASSWQCEGLAAIKRSPQISLLTNLDRDHLNTYKTYADYVRAKSLLFKYQTKADWAIFNNDDVPSRRLAKKMPAAKKYFSLRSRSGNYVQAGRLYYRGKFLLKVEDLPLIGQHNLSNILGALAVAEILRLTLSDLRRALLTYRPLSGRLQLIREKRGVRYINDTTATAPSAVIASLQALTAPLILIAGGVDKKLDLERLAKVISGRVRRLILLPGSATDKLVVFLKRLGYQDYQLADSMAAAVQMAATLARRGEVVLLSPGAASFGLFINEFDRGDKFNQAVKTL